VDLPLTGGATYTGPFVGRFADTTAATVYTVSAAATAQADFLNRSVNFFTEGSSKTPISGPGAGGQDLRLNLSGRMRYDAGVNGMSSSLPGGIAATSQAGGFNMSGEVAARFMGPPGTTAPFAPPELAGAVAVKNLGETQSMVGSFALKKQ
jgi:hypothetical protein